MHRLLMLIPAIRMLPSTALSETLILEQLTYPWVMWALLHKQRSIEMLEDLITPMHIMRVATWMGRGVISTEVSILLLKTCNILTKPRSRELMKTRTLEEWWEAPQAELCSATVLPKIDLSKSCSKVISLNPIKLVRIRHHLNHCVLTLPTSGAMVERTATQLTWNLSTLMFNQRFPTK